jgi:hypothetical protein
MPNRFLPEPNRALQQRLEGEARSQRSAVQRQRWHGKTRMTSFPDRLADTRPIWIDVGQVDVDPGAWSVTARATMTIPLTVSNEAFTGRERALGRLLAVDQARNEIFEIDSDQVSLAATPAIDTAGAATVNSPQGYADGEASLQVVLFGLVTLQDPASILLTVQCEDTAFADFTSSVAMTWRSVRIMAVPA